MRNPLMKKPWISLNSDYVRFLFENIARTGPMFTRNLFSNYIVFRRHLSIECLGRAKKFVQCLKPSIEYSGRTYKFTMANLNCSFPVIPCFSHVNTVFIYHDYQCVVLYDTSLSFEMVVYALLHFYLL